MGGSAEGRGCVSPALQILSGMPQLQLCPWVEVCWGRSGRWADEITEVKAARE